MVARPIYLLLKMNSEDFITQFTAKREEDVEELPKARLMRLPCPNAEGKEYAKSKELCLKVLRGLCPEGLHVVDVEAHVDSTTPGRPTFKCVWKAEYGILEYLSTNFHDQVSAVELSKPHFTWVDCKRSAIPFYIEAVYKISKCVCNNRFIYCGGYFTLEHLENPCY